MPKVLRKIAVFAFVAVVASAAILFLSSRSSDLPEKPNFDFPTGAISLSLLLPELPPGPVDDAIELYSRAHPNVSIYYKTLDRDTYSKSVQEQLKFGKPADIIALKNDYIAVNSANLASVDSAVMNADYFNRNFHENQRVDLARKEGYLGVPLSSGSLSLFTNYELLSKSSIKTPETWDDVLDATIKLTQKKDGRITVGGIGLGTESNTDHAADLLATLILQNGGLITSADKKHALFNEPETSTYFPGTEAVKFYTAFSNPTKDIYSWDSSLGRARTEFAAGKLAMYLGVPDDTYKIKIASPNLKFSVSQFPQIKGGKQIITPNYWILGVSKDSENRLVAWDFVKFLTNGKNSKNITESAFLPTTGTGGATATSFYKGDPAKFEVIFRTMIERVRKGENPQKVVDQQAASLTRSL